MAVLAKTCTDKELQSGPASVMERSFRGLSPGGQLQSLSLFAYKATTVATKLATIQLVGRELVSHIETQSVLLNRGWSPHVRGTTYLLSLGYYRSRMYMISFHLWNYNRHLCRLRPAIVQSPNSDRGACMRACRSCAQSLLHQTVSRHML